MREFSTCCEEQRAYLVTTSVSLVTASWQSSLPSVTHSHCCSRQFPSEYVFAAVLLPVAISDDWGSQLSHWLWEITTGNSTRHQPMLYNTPVQNFWVARCLSRHWTILENHWLHLILSSSTKWLQNQRSSLTITLVVVHCYTYVPCSNYFTNIS